MALWVLVAALEATHQASSGLRLSSPDAANVTQRYFHEERVEDHAAPLDRQLVSVTAEAGLVSETRGEEVGASMRDTRTVRKPARVETAARWPRHFNSEPEASPASLDMAQGAIPEAASAALAALAAEHAGAATSGPGETIENAVEVASAASAAEVVAATAAADAAAVAEVAKVVKVAAAAGTMETTDTDAAAATKVAATNDPASRNSFIGVIVEEVRPGSSSADAAPEASVLEKQRAAKVEERPAVLQCVLAALGIIVILWAFGYQWRRDHQPQDSSRRSTREPVVGLRTSGWYNGRHAKFAAEDGDPDQDFLDHAYELPGEAGAENPRQASLGRQPGQGGQRDAGRTSSRARAEPAADQSPQLAVSRAKTWQRGADGGALTLPVAPKTGDD